MSKREPIITTSEPERIAKLGEYFRNYLFGWLAEMLPGVRFTPGIERELSLALLELGCAVRLSLDKLGDDEQNVAHAQAVAKRFADELDREVLDG